MQLSVIMSVSLSCWSKCRECTVHGAPYADILVRTLESLVQVTTFAVEGLRIAPLAIALLRRFIGPRLTKKERSSTFMGLAPLNEPEDFPHADFLSNMVLFFVILLVYAVIAPLCCFVLALCFGVMISLFRHQFVYIYNRGPDTGGFM